MTHDDKLKLASAMAQKSTEEAPAPEIQTNGDQPAQTGTHAPSSLISEINAPVDLGQVHWFTTNMLGRKLSFGPSDYAHCFGYWFTNDRTSKNPSEVNCPACWPAAVEVLTERARIRAIVMRLMGNEWSANQLLEEIGE